MLCERASTFPQMCEDDREVVLVFVVSFLFVCNSNKS